MSECIYVISSSSGHVKIGRSVQPRKRLSELQVAMPLKLDLAFVVHVSNGPHGRQLSHTVEKLAHRLAAPFHAHGEWFSLSVEEAAGLVLEAADRSAATVSDVSSRFVPAGRELVSMSPPVRLENVSAFYREARLALPDYVMASKAPATQRAYGGIWRDFTDWCEVNHVDPLPAKPEIVAVYLVELAKRGVAVSTINQRCAAISHFHKQARQENPVAHSGVQTVLAGIRRTHTRRPSKKQALTADLVAKVVRKIPAKDPRGLRDRALILLCFGAALRRSELVALTVADLEWHRRGLLVRLGRTKTDQAGEGRTVAIPEGKLKVGEAVRAWLDASGIVEGPLFPISASQFARMLKTRCAAIGLDPDLIGGHSPRRGFATSAGDVGADLRHTARHMRHAKLETTLGYMEDGDLFRESAGKGFL